MPRFYKNYNQTGNINAESSGVEELAFLEKAIDRRLAIFLVFFTVVIVGALGSGSSSLSAAGFSIGSIICWLLAISIILTTRKTGAIAKALKKEVGGIVASIEAGIYAKFVRWILGYIIPVFCSIVLTFGSVASSVGWLNDIWFYRFKVESKIDEIKNNLPEIEFKKKNEVAKPEPNKNFEPIDSVMNSTIKIPVSSQTTNSQVEENYKPIESATPPEKKKTQEVKTAKPDKNFKPIDKLTN